MSNLIFLILVYLYAPVILVILTEILLLVIIPPLTIGGTLQTLSVTLASLILLFPYLRVLSSCLEALVRERQLQELSRHVFKVCFVGLLRQRD